MSRQAQVWAWVLGTAAGVAALAGAGQLGIGYGLGFLRLAREFPNDGRWSAQLTWVAWFAILAVISGAVAGAWAARRRELELHWGTRFAVAVTAGLGASVVVPLTLLPADAATVLVRERPVLATALTALLGVVVGIAAAVATLSVRIVAVSLAMLVAAVWLLALISALPALLPGADPPDARLAVLDLAITGGGSGSTVAVVTIPLVALLVCGAVAAAARSRGLSPLLTALASTAAPGLLAVTYLIGTPGTGDRAVQTSPYAAALIAVAVGLLTSLLVGTVRLPSGRPAGTDPDPDPDPADTVGFHMAPLTAPGPSPVSPAGESPTSPVEARDSTFTLPGPGSPATEPPDQRSPAWPEPASRPTPPAPPAPPASALLDQPARSDPPGRSTPTPPSSAPPAWPAPADLGRPERPGGDYRPGDTSGQMTSGTAFERSTNRGSDRPAEVDSPTSASDRISERIADLIAQFDRPQADADRLTSDDVDRPASSRFEPPASSRFDSPAAPDKPSDRPSTSRFDPPTPATPDAPFTSRFDPPASTRFNPPAAMSGSGSAPSPAVPTNPEPALESSRFQIPKARRPSDQPAGARFDPPSWAVTDPTTPEPAALAGARGPVPTAEPAPRDTHTGPTPSAPQLSEPALTESAPGEPAEPGAEDSPPVPAKRWSRLLKPKQHRQSSPPPLPPDPVASLPAPRLPEAEPAPEPDAAPGQPASPPPLTPPRRKREGEEEHLDWISSLANDDDGEELEETGRSRRRLRRDRDLSMSTDELPEPPSRPVHRP